MTTAETTFRRRLLARKSSGIGFAIASNRVKDIASQLIRDRIENVLKAP